MSFDDKYLKRFKKKLAALEEEKNFNYCIREVRLNNINDEIRTLEKLIEFLER